MPALDYGSDVARLYDKYCTFSADIPFFSDLSASWSGPVLELMAGTGRVSMPLVREGTNLTCVDSSPHMLRVLKGKLQRAGLLARLLWADATLLPFAPGTFDNVVLPFNGLSELLTQEARASMLREVSCVLVPEGQFVCSLHNPVVRLGTIDGTWNMVGEFPQEDGSTLKVSIRARWVPEILLVTGQQRIERLAPEGSETSEVLSLALKFSLPPLAEVVDMARGVDLRLVKCYGDYSQESYHPDESPFIIMVFAKTA
jgi:SAM-dependent methyltransferase